MKRSPLPSPASAAYRCGAAARWLPRTLAGSLLGAALIATRRVDPELVISGSRGFRTAVVVLAAILALWILRRGSEVRLRIEVTDGSDLLFQLGAQRFTLRLRDVDALRYDAPFGVSRSWLPATVLIDREGREWRLPGLLDAGDRLVDDVLRGTEQPNLEAWAQALRIRSRMRRGSQRVRIGYATAAAIFAAGVLYYGAGM